MRILTTVIVVLLLIGLIPSVAHAQYKPSTPDIGTYEWAASATVDRMIIFENADSSEADHDTGDAFTYGLKSEFSSRGFSILAWGDTVYVAGYTFYSQAPVDSLTLLPVEAGGVPLRLSFAQSGYDSVRVWTQHNRTGSSVEAGGFTYVGAEK